MKIHLILSIIYLTFLVNEGVCNNHQPHIIVIVADDLGWNDVGFHGSTQIPTPNIDSLAYGGVILNNYYVQPICTPSRSALLSGMHPIHTGLNHDVIMAPQPFGLPLKFQILPQYLNKFEYKSHIVGKWHLGMFLKKYTPTFRGFSSHFGYWTGSKDYYSHTAMEGVDTLSACMPGWWGYDFRRNEDVDRSVYGEYTTDLLTRESVKIINEHNSTKPLFLYLAHLAVHSGNPYDPLQAPDDVVKKFSYIKDIHRRKFAGMLSKLDESVGNVIKALEENQMLQNSIIVFTTDNGGPAAGFNSNAASNWPLRGVKYGLWEGGIRGAAFVWSPLLRKPGRVSMEMMQVEDWLPTLYSAAGGNPQDLPDTLDGIDAWDMIANCSSSSRFKMLHNIDPISGSGAVRVGEWKLVYKPSGYGEKWNGWYGPSGRKEHKLHLSKSKKYKTLLKNSLTSSAIKKYNRNLFKNLNQLILDAEILCGPVPENATKECNDPANPCLFHIPSDPCEYHDVSHIYPQRVKLLQETLEAFNKTAVPPGNKPWDPKANPVYWNYAWTDWQDFKIIPSFNSKLIRPPPAEDDNGFWL